MTLRRVHVVGAGLVGASIGLALRNQGVEVFLSDLDDRRLRLAAELGAGEPLTISSSGAGEDDEVSQIDGAADPADLVVLCVPPAQIAYVLLRVQRLGLGGTYSDVGSVKTRPQVEAERLGADLSKFVGGHPIAGRERTGPGNARADLFVGRPWVLTPTPETSEAAMSTATALVELCGARVVRLSPEDHDAAMALLSHLPQALASALASRLTGVNAEWLGLAGQGFEDMTRIADSDPGLWAEIAAGNAQRLAAELRGISSDLAALAQGVADSADAGDAAESQGSAAFSAVVQAGNLGRARLPGKHGAHRQPYVPVPVVVADEPGVLARLLTDAGAAGINVEDLSLEHSPGAPVGLCELLVRPESASELQRVLHERGWSVHEPTQSRETN